MTVSELFCVYFHEVVEPELFGEMMEFATQMYDFFLIVERALCGG